MVATPLYRIYAHCARWPGTNMGAVFGRMQVCAHGSGRGVGVYFSKTVCVLEMKHNKSIYVMSYLAFDFIISLFFSKGVFPSFL
jgi:hypothetical protein